MNNIKCYKKFAIANSIIALLLSFCYIPNAVDSPNNLIELLFLVTTHIGYVALLTAICSIALLPVVVLPRIIMQPILAVASSILLVALLLDIIVYSHFKMHLSVISPALLALKATDLQRFESIIFIATFIAIVLFELYLVSRFIKQNSNINNKYNYIFASIISICMLISYSLFAINNHEAQQKFVKITSYVALFNATNELDPLLKLNNISSNKMLAVSTLAFPQMHNKNYNIKPITYNNVATPKNILIIGIDAWRADKLNPTDTPCLWKYAQKGKIFNNHMAAANNTKASTFGLFYGIPADYFEFVTATKQSPVLVDRLQQLNYQLGVFYSASVDDIELNKNIFAKVANLRPGSTASTPALRDQQATDDWINWYTNCNKKLPMFSFIFYDSVHEYDFPPEYNQEHTPLRGEKRYCEIAAEYGQDIMNQLYSISTSYVDSLAGQVLDKLEQTGDLENTLIVITSDHGHELDDYNHGSWGHGTNLSSAQLHVPFVIIDKKFNNTDEPIESDKLTSHFDLVPTLLTEYLGVTNDTEDYSIGYNLLREDLEHKWVLASGRDKYLNYFGVCDENYRVKLLPSGFYRLFDTNNNVLPEINLNYNQINQAFNYIKKFIH
jgi:membrane-anchored protein YejM (alkaline phosphatase superfamily)